MRISDWSSDVSASSVRLMRLMSDGSDLDIFALPSRRLMIRAAPGGMIGSGRVKTGRSSLAKSLLRSEEHTSELQSLMRISYAVFCLKKKKQKPRTYNQE